jgi:hypothetical protein
VLREAQGMIDPMPGTLHQRIRCVQSQMWAKIRYALGHALDSVPQFRQGDDAEEHAVLIDLGKPRGHARVGPWLYPFRDYVGIEQEIHRSGARG